MNNMKSVARINMNRLYPSAYYAMPSISPLFVGMNGQTGMAQANNLAMYNYTIKQMAMSPFSVNSQEYMKRIREEYGYTDSGMYDAMGTIGAVVGSGIGAYMGTGAYQGIVKSSTGFNVFKPSTYSKLELQNPFRNPFDPKTFSSKQQRTSAAFRQPEAAEFNKFYDNNKTLIERYNEAVNKRSSIESKVNTYSKDYKTYKTYTDQIKNLNKQLDELKASPDTLDILKKRQSITNNIDDIKKEMSDLNIDEDTYKAYLKDVDELNSASKNVDNITTDILKNADGLSPKALSHLDEAVSTVKPISKMGHAFMSYAGTALDVASVGMNIAGASQAFQDNQYLVGALYTFGALNDAASVAGDIVASIPTPVTAVVGQVLNIVGTVMSMAADAIIGALTGATIGHSLSSEGAKAQQLYASNLYASSIQRPISTVATALTMFGVPAALNRLGVLQGSKVGILKGIGKTADFLTDNAWGNYLRASLNMMAVSGIQNIVAPVEEKIFKVPDNPEDVNFVTAFALVGDLNDNLFGATARKATLIGLAKGDSSAQTDAIARAWGFSNTDTYYSPTFDDVRQALGWELSPIGNSLFSTIGEILIDPQNLSEIAVEVELEKVIETGARSTAAILNMERAKVLSGDIVDPDIIRTMFRTTKDGQIIKTAYRVKEATGYRYITPDEAKSLDPSQYEAIDVIKEGNEYWSYSYLRNKEEGAQPTEIAQKVNITDEQYKSYDYQTTRLGKLSKSDLEKELGAYVRKYITNGDEGLSDVYINSLSMVKGSSTKVMYGRDTAFVPALKKYIDQALTGTYHTNADVIRNRINTQSPEEREKYIKDTLSLYSYYEQTGQDTTQLLNKLFMDFNMVLSTDQLRKLYYTHSGFRTQMDLIQNTMGTINKLANPVAWGINSGLMHIGNFLLQQSSEIKDEKKMRLILNLDEALDNKDIIKQKDINDINTRVSERYSKNMDYQEIQKELNKVIDDALKTKDSGIAKAVADHEEAIAAIKALEEQANYFKNQTEQSTLKSWEYRNDKSTIYIEIKDESDAQELRKKIVDLESKETRLTTKEKKELKEYRKAYFYYKYSTGTMKHLGHLCGSLSSHIAILDTFSLQANTHLIDIIRKISKFSTIYTDTVVKETPKQTTSKKGKPKTVITKTQVHHTDAEKAKIFNEEFDNIHKIFTSLGLDVRVLKDGKEYTYDDVMSIIRKDPKWYADLRIQRTMDFTDVVKIVLNDTLQQLHGQYNMHALEIVGMSDIINSWLNDGGINVWKNYTGNKAKYVQVLIKKIAELYKGTELEAYYKDLCVVENTEAIVKTIDEYVKHEAKDGIHKGKIVFDRAIVDVSPSFLRAIAFEQVYKENETDINNVLKSIRSTSKYVELLSKFVEQDDQELYKHFLESQVDVFTNALQNTTMYEFIQSYLRVYHPEETYVLSLNRNVYEGIPTLSKQAINNIVKEGKANNKTRAFVNAVAEHLEHYDTEDEYDSTQRISNYNATKKIEEVVKDVEENNVILDQDNNELSEDTVPIEDNDKRTFAPKGAYQEFINRVEVHERAEEAFEETRDSIEKEFPFINQVKRNISFEYKGDQTQKEKLGYYIKSLVNPSKRNAILFKGSMRIHIKPVTLIDDEGNKYAYTKLGINEYGYDSTIESVIDSLVEQLINKDYNTIKAIYIGSKSYLTSSSKNINIDKVKKDLVKAYKDGKLSIAYDNTYKRGGINGKILSKTTRYFTIKLRAEFNKQLHIAINNRNAVGFDYVKYCDYNIDKDEYTIKKDGIQTYVSDIMDNPNADKASVEFLQNLYKDAIAKVEESFAYDRGVTANSYIRDWENKLRRYELTTFAGSNPTTATVSTDTLAKVLINDPYFVEELKAIADLPELIKSGKPASTVFTRTLLRIQEHIEVSTRRKRKLNLDEFVAIEYERGLNADDQGEYYFKKSDGTKVPMISLVLDYRISRSTLTKLIELVHNKTQDHIYISMSGGIKTHYDKLIETTKVYSKAMQEISEDDYVTMVKSLPENANKTDEEIRRAYNILSTHWYEQETSAQFLLSKTVGGKGKYKQYLTKDVIDVFNKADLDYSNNVPIEYKGTKYSVELKPGETTIQSFDFYFLISILNSKLSPDKKAMLLKDTFFFDYKVAKGMGGDESIANVEAEIKACEEYIHDLEQDMQDQLNNPNGNRNYFEMQEALKRAKTYRAELQGKYEYFKEIGDNIKNFKKPEIFIDQVIKGVIDLPKLQQIYNNHTRISDTTKYLPVFTEDGSVIFVKREYAKTETEGKGAGPLNPQIIGRFRYELETNAAFSKINIKGVEYDAWKKDIHASRNSILVKLPEDSTLTGKEIAELKLKLQSTYTNVYILTDKSYKEIVDMFHSNKIETYNKYTTKISDVKNEDGTPKYTTYAGEVENQLNVKGSKVRTPALIHDLYLIQDYLKHGTYEKLKEYLDVEEYIKFYKSYGVDNRFSTSDTFHKLVKCTKTTIAFFEFIEAFKNREGKIPFNLNALADYFTNDTIKYKRYSKETSVWRELEHIEINGRKGTDVLEEIIDKLYNEYKDTDVDFDASNVLHSHEMLDTIDNLYRLMIEYTKQDRDYLKQAELLVNLSRRYTNPEIENIKDTQLKEQYNVHNMLYDQFREYTKGKTNGTGVNSLIFKWCKKNQKLAVRTLKEQRDSHAIQISNYKNSNVNLKTMYRIIPKFEELMKTIKQGNNITANDFSIVQQLWDSVQMDAGKDLLTEILGKIKRNKSFKTDDEVYTYMFKEIIYPLVQNITLDFYRAGGLSLYFSMQDEMPGGINVHRIYTDKETQEFINIASDISNSYNNAKTPQEFITKLEDAKLNTTKLIKKYSTGKTYYNVNIDNYIDKIIKAVNETFFDDAITVLKDFIDKGVNNNEALVKVKPYLQALLEVFPNNVPVAGEFIQSIALQELQSNIHISDIALRIEHEYEKLENKKTRNYRIKPEIHFKKYNYKDTVNLQRSNVFVYADNKMREEQKADTFALFMNTKFGIDETDASTFISKLAYSLTKTQDFTDTTTKKDIDFYDTSTLFELENKVMSDDEKYLNIIKQKIHKNNPTLTKEEVEEHSKQLYLKWLRYAQTNKKDIYRASHGDKQAYKYSVRVFTEIVDDALKLNLTADDAQKMYTHIAEFWGRNKAYANTYYNIIYTLKNKIDSQENEKLPTNKWDLISLFNTDVMLYDKDFFSFFKLMFNKKDVEKLIAQLPKDTEQTLIDAIKVLTYNLTSLNLPANIKDLIKQKQVLNTFFGDISSDFYKLHGDEHTEQLKLMALTMLINEAKDLYRQAYVTYVDRNGNKGTYSWDYARKPLERDKRRRNEQIVHSLSATNVFYGTRDDGTNIFTDLSLPIRNMKKGRNFIKALNNNLSQMIVSNRKRYTKSIEPVTIVYRENELNTQLRKIQQYYTGPLFKETSLETSLDTSMDKDLKQELERAYASSYLYLTSEASAPSIDKLVTINNTYHKISELFTSVLRILHPTMNNTDFIKISDITTFLRLTKARTEYTAFYLDKFDLWKSTESDELNKAIHSVVEHFKNKSYLIDINDKQVKAFFGYMYYNKFSSAFGKAISNEQKAKEIQEYIIENWIKQQELNQTKAKDIKTKLYNIMYSDLTIEDKASNILRILYRNTKEQEQHRPEITEFLDMLNANNFKRLMVNNKKYDTLEALEDDPEYMDALYQYKQSTTILADEQYQLEQLYERADKLIKTVRAEKGNVTKKKIDVRYQDNTIDTGKEQPLKYTAITDDTYTQAIDEIQKQIDTLERRKESIKTEQEKRKQYLYQRTQQFMLNFVNNTKYLSYYNSLVSEEFDETITKIQSNLDAKKNYVDKWPDLWDVVKHHVEIYKKIYDKEYKIVDAYRPGFESATEMLHDNDLVMSVCLDLNLDIQNHKDMDKAKQVIEKYWNTIKELDGNSSAILAQKYLDEHPDLKSKKATIKKQIEEASKIYRKLNGTIALKEMYKDKSIFNTKDIADQEILQEYIKEFSDKDDDVPTKDWMIIKDAVNWDIVKKVYVYAVKDIRKTINKAKKEVKEQTTQSVLNDLDNTPLSKESIRNRIDTQKRSITKVNKIIAATFLKWVNNKNTRELSTTTLIKNAINRKFNERGGTAYINNKFNIDEKHTEILNSIESTLKHINKKIKQLEQEQNKETEIKKLKDYKEYTEKIYKSIKENKTKKKNALNLIEALKKHKPITDEEYKAIQKEQVISLTKELLDTDEITDEDINILTDVLESDYSYSKDSMYSGIKAELTTVNNDIKSLTAQRNIIDTHKYSTQELENISKQIKDKKEKRDGLIEEYNYARTTYDKHMKNRTNSKLYRKYSGLNDSADVVKHVIKRAIEDGILNDAQRKQIQDAGKVDLHNPVVDILLTLYNYAYQHKDVVTNNKIDWTKLPETFIVMDMETVRDLNNNPIPYQISIIKVQIENGLPKTQIATASYNNMAFSDGTIDAPNPLLAQFIEDQTAILRKENPSITDEEIKEHVTEIVNRHKYLKNNIASTNAVINILNQADCPIVAHNGNKFDFSVFDQHIQTYAERLIMNEFNSILYNLDIDQIRERAGIAPDFDIDGLPKELQDEFRSEWFRRLQLTGKITTETERARLQAVADKFAKYQINLYVEQKYTEVLQQQGYVKDPEEYRKITKDPDSPYNRITNHITEYVKADATRQKELLQIVYEILKETDNNLQIETVEKLLQSINESVNSYRDGTKQIEFTLSKRQQIIQQVFERLNLPQEQWEQFDYSSRVQALEAQIQSINELVVILQDPKALDDYQKHVQAQQDEKAMLKQQYNELEKEIDKYTKQIEKLQTQENDVLKGIAEAYAHIRDIELPAIARAQSLIFANSAAATQTSSSRIAEHMTTLDLLTNELKDTMWTLQFILKVMQGHATDTDFNTVMVHPALLGITKVADVQTTKTVLEAETKRLERILKQLESGSYEILHNTKDQILKIAENNKELSINNLLQHIDYMLSKQYAVDIIEVLNEFKDTVKADDIQKAVQTVFYKLRNTIKHSVEMKNNDDVRALIKLTSKKSLLNNTLTLLKAKDSTDYYNENLVEVYKTWIQTQINTNKQTITLIDAVESTTINKRIINNLKDYVDHATKQLTEVNKDINLIYAEAIEQSLFRQSGTSIYYGDPNDKEAVAKHKAQFEKEARKRADETAFTKEMRERYGVEFIKKDVNQGNDVEGYTISSKYVWYQDIEPKLEDDDDTKGRIKIYTIDEENNQLQVLDIPYELKTQKDGTTKREYTKLEDCYFTFTYNYKQKGHEYQHTQKVIKRYKYSDITKIDKLFTTETTKNKNTLLPVKSENLFKPSLDTSQASIKQLYNYIQKLSSKKNVDILKAISDTAVNIKHVPNDKLAHINISNKVRERFTEYLPLLSAIQEDNPKVMNPQVLYENIYNQVLAEYKISSVNPAKYLSLLPEEIEQNLMWYVTDEGNKKFNIDKKYVTEANMGRKFNPISLYSCDELFSINTNYVRTLLASSLFRFKYSVLGVVNELYRDNKDAENEDFNLALALDDYKLDERIKTRIEKLQNEPDNKGVKIELITEQATKIETELYEARKKLLLTKYTYNGEEHTSNVFTPHVGTITQQENFRKNIYIQGGVNLTVAFADDPRAHEDTMLIDADDAKALGATQTNKLWLKFGFKGGIRIVPGLRKMYGASIVASRQSVIKRGSYGMYMEMASNKIREFRLGILDKNDPAYKYLDSIKEHLENKIIQYDTYDENVKHGGMFLVKDKLYVSPDYDESQFNELLKPLLENHPDKDYTMLINSKATVGTTYELNDPTTNKTLSFTFDETNNTITKGQIYVVFDAEHIAAEAQTLSRISKDDPELTFLERDIRGSVQHGGMVSNTFIQSLAMVIGEYNVNKAIVGAENLDTEEKMRRAFEVKIKGVQALHDIEKTEGIKIFVYEDNKLNVDDTVDNIVKVLTEQYRSLAQLYCGTLKQIERDGINRDLKLKDINTRFRKTAMASIGTDTGVVYRTEHKRYAAARNQLLTNTDLKRGEVRMPIASYEALINLDKNAWIKAEDLSKDELSNIQNKLENMSAVDAYEYLLSIGIYERNKNGKQQFKLINPVWETTQGHKRLIYAERIDFTILDDDFNPVLQKTIAYVLGARSPIQDYKATPVLKIVGLNQHSGMECHPAMYKYMGGDNDGDTAAFIPVKYEEVENGMLSFADSTKKEFYDKGYLESVSDDLFINYKDSNNHYVEAQKDPYHTSSIQSAHMGKKALPNEVAALKDRNGQTDRHYLLVEMLGDAGQKIFDSLYDEAIQDDDIKKIHKYLSFDNDIDNQELRWVHAHVVHTHSGVSEPNELQGLYKDPSKWNAYYNTHIKEIQKLQIIEHYLRKLFNNGNIEYKKDMVEYARNHTLYRGRVAKALIGVIGGLRKVAYLNTSLSVFPELNKDKTCKVWTKEYGISENKLNTLSVNDLINSVFIDTNDKPITIEQYKHLINLSVDDVKKHPLFNKNRASSLDIDRVIVYLQERMSEIVEVEERIKDVYTLLFKSEKITYGDIKKYITDVEESKGTSMLYMPVYIEWLKNMTATELNQPADENTIIDMKAYYFSRFDKKAEKNEFKIKDTKYDIKDYYVKQLLDQKIFTRIQASALDKAIQIPISESKHGSILTNPVVLEQQLEARARAIVKKLEGRNIYFGNNMEHKRGILMAFEYDIYNRRDIKIEQDTQVQEYKSKVATERTITDTITKRNAKSALNKAVNNIFINEVCGGLLTTVDWEGDSRTGTQGFIQHFKHLNNVLTRSAKQNNNILDINKLFTEESAETIDALIKDIQFFQELGIPAYKLKFGIVNGHAKYIEAKYVQNNLTKPSLLDNTLQLYLLCGTSYADLNAKYNTTTAPAKQKYFINYITGRNNPSELLVSLLGEDNEIMKSNIINEMNRTQTRDERFDSYLKDLVDGGKINQDQYIAIKQALLQPLSEKTNDEILTKINFDAAQKGLSLLDVLKKKLSEVLRTQNTIDLEQKRLNKELQTDKEDKLVSHIYKQQLGTHLYLKDSQSIVEFKNKLNRLRKEKEELEKEITKKKNTINKLNKNINQLNEYSEHLKTKTPNELIKALEKEKAEHEQQLDEILNTLIKHSIYEHFGPELYKLGSTNNPNTPKPVELNQETINNFQDDLIMQMDKYQHPFNILIDAFKRTSKTGDEYIDWDTLYKYLKDNWRYIRITEVIKAGKDEGLARTFIDYISVQDTNKYKNSKGEDVTWEYLTDKEKFKYYKEHQKIVELNSFEDLQNKFKEAVGTKFKFNKKEYDALGNELNVDDFFTPTLKQIKIKSPQDLKRIYNTLIEKGDEAPLIGFTYINDIISSIEDAYKPYRVGGLASRYVNKFNIAQKAALRFSAGFLLRNAMDVFLQLSSDMYLERGLTPMIFKPAQVARYLKYGDHIFQVYEFLNDERMFTLIDVLHNYDLYNETIDVNEKQQYKNKLNEYLTRYIQQAQAQPSINNHIRNRLNTALDLQSRLNTNKNTERTLSYITTFLLNTTFAEYYLFYDNKTVGTKSIQGLRMDADETNKDQRIPNKIKRILSEQDDLFKSLLIEVSAFMQTNAQVDMFKQKQYEELDKIVAQNKNDTQQYTIDDVRKQVQEFRFNTTNKFVAWSKDKVGNLYQNMTNYTENIARIMGFILNRDLYGYSFDESVQRSLKSWFNYGQRTPIEVQLSYDIPYISFPIRSISNWITRILDPRYARFMDDIIDGIYGQYADEDGQYSEWEQFMIKNGWIPMFNGLGIRAGNGAFDIMNLLSNPTENIKQRYNPILRGLNEFIESGDLTKAVKQLATFGVMNRVANAVAPRQLNQATGIGSTKPKTLANSSSMFFEYNEDEYNKYIPYRYRYPNNGRYKYYENIYKDWFNKYGRMRKPTKDPVTLVNNIQWQQYLKYRRNRTRR